MKTPTRLYILQRLTALLTDTYGTDAEGNPYDLTNSVFRGRPEFGADAPIPMLSILEDPRPAFGNNAGGNEVRAEPRWNLLLQGWAADDQENPTDPAHWLMASVEERLGLVNAKRSDGSNRPVSSEWFHLGMKDTIMSFEYGPGIVRPGDKGVSEKAYFYLPVRIGLAVSMIEPYRPS